MRGDLEPSTPQQAAPIHSDYGLLIIAAILIVFGITSTDRVSGFVLILIAFAFIAYEGQTVVRRRNGR